MELSQFLSKKGMAASVDVIPALVYRSPAFATGAFACN